MFINIDASRNRYEQLVKLIRPNIAVCSFFIIVSLLLTISGCKESATNDKMKDYGVFLSLDSASMDKIAEYKTVVIDAQYFSKKDIGFLKAQGCKVYSYINIGAIENFREYYDTFSGLALGEYENWDEEQWMDVSSKDWQEFLALLEEELLDKGIDGFFVDNCDVYYEYPSNDIFKGLTAILQHLMEFDKAVIVNGGDTYIMKYRECCGSLKSIMTGVNQESVWSKIDFDTEKFLAQTENDRNFFQDYIELCKSDGLDVYLLEYTTDDTLKQKIEE